MRENVLLTFGVMQESIDKFNFIFFTYHFFVKRAAKLYFTNFSFRVHLDNLNKISVTLFKQVLGNL